MKLFRGILGLSFSMIITSCTLGLQNKSVDSLNNSLTSVDTPISEELTSDLNSQASSDIPSTSVLPNSSTSNSTSIFDPNAPLTFEDVFDIHNTIKIDINVSKEELVKIQDDFYEYDRRGLKSPIYRRCDEVTIIINKNGRDYVYSYEDVGIRMKGNTSRTDFIDERSGDIYNNIHFKLSFEETFDNPLYYKESERTIWTDSAAKLAREDRKFFEMSKLDLRFNRCEDHAFIREYYALEMFRDFGILSQHSNFGQVVIHEGNKSPFNYGLYLVTEPLNKSFIKHSLESTKTYIGMADWNEEKNGTIGVSGSKYGQLYKASYGLGSGLGRADFTSTDDRLFGIEPEDASYLPVYELKTNKDTNDHSLIKNMISTIMNKSADEIASKIDMEYFTMYEAIATVLGDPDDLRNNYNNYAMYFRRTDGKMVIIPIDQDRVLGISKYWDPTGSAMTEVSPFSNRAEGAGENQQNNLYNKTILADTTYASLYKENLKKVLDSKWIKEETFNEIYNIVKNHYENISHTSIFNLEWSLEDFYRGSDQNMSFAVYIQNKMKTINRALNIGDDNDDNNDNDDKLNVIANYTTFYLTGEMDNWNKTTEEYKFKREESYLYTYDYIIDRESLECKIYTTDDGGRWLRSENGGYLQFHGDNIRLIFDKDFIQRVLHFEINTLTGKMSWSIYFNTWN